MKGCGKLQRTNYAELNNVSSSNQLQKNDCVDIVIKKNNALKVLFVGNSITRHAPKPTIGWHGDWGMAASDRALDYVHRIISYLEEYYGPINYCIAQIAEWERDYTNGQRILDKHYQKAKDFRADIVIVRVGENIKVDTHNRTSCKPYYEEMIKYFVTNKDAKVIVTDLFWHVDELDNIIFDVAKENNYIFCQLHDLQDEENTMAIGQYEHEGVSLHPSNYGMECIAKRILEKLDPLI